VSKRIVFGLVAWLLGAATATAGSLLAVSLLGQGIGGSSSQQLTRDAVNHALANEAAENSPSVPATGSRTAHPAAMPSRPSTPSATATPDLSAPPPSATATPAETGASSNPGGTVLTSKGGEVVASCQPAGAYLLSWYPLQGYEIGDVARGPASTAWVTFESGDSEVRMVVTCSAGVPSATTSTRSGDD
jgi:hypothetical protein